MDTIVSIARKNCRINVIGADRPFDRIMYFFCAETVNIIPPDSVCLAMVYPEDWNNLMTPWEYSGKPFGSLAKAGAKEVITGGGMEFAIEFAISGTRDVRDALGLDDNILQGIGGYSFGGLEALYMAYTQPVFDFAASVSGSLWYPGAMEYFTGNEPLNGIRGTYLSIGAREAMDKDEMRSKVIDNTKALAKWLGEDSPGADDRETMFELNMGGHFTEVKERIMRCLNYYTTLE